MKKIPLTIATPTGVVYQGETEQITVTTSSGEITILPNHIPLISHLEVGHVIIKNGEQEDVFAISGGVLEVRPDHTVLILSNKSEHADDIDIERAEQAAREAAEYMKHPEKVKDVDYKKLQTLLRREENRARIARKGHRK